MPPPQYGQLSFPPLLDNSKWRNATSDQNFPGGSYTWRKSLQPRPLRHKPSPSRLRLILAVPEARRLAGRVERKRVGPLGVGLPDEEKDRDASQRHRQLNLGLRVHSRSYRFAQVAAKFGILHAPLVLRAASRAGASKRVVSTASIRTRRGAGASRASGAPARGAPAPRRPRCCPDLAHDGDELLEDGGRSGRRSAAVVHGGAVRCWRALPGGSTSTPLRATHAGARRARCLAIAQ